MANENDNRIMKLKEVIADKRKELSKLRHRVQPITNCQLTIDGATHNLHAADPIYLYVKLHSLIIAAQDCCIDPNTIIICGYSIQDWESVLKQFIDVKKYEAENHKLKTLEMKLTNLLSDDKQTELAIDEIAALLED